MIIDPPISFVGPATWRCFGKPYLTLTSSGVKAEGGEYPLPWFGSPAEAVAALHDQIDAYAESSVASQIAWRRLPQTKRMTNGQFVASARLVAF